MTQVAESYPAGQAQDSDEDSPDDLRWSRVREEYEAQGPNGTARALAARLAMDEETWAARYDNQHLYWFDPDEAVFDERGDEALLELLVDRIPNYFTPYEQKVVGKIIKARTFREEFGAEGIVPVANGDLVVEPGQKPIILEPDPDRAPLARSSAEWDPEAEAPQFREFLREVVQSEEERQLLREYVGYGLLTWDLPFHRALFIAGPTRSGKSTFLQLVESLYGKTSNLSPQQMTSQRFDAIALEGAWANVLNDIPAAMIEDTAKFKMITAGDPIRVERKYEQGYSLEPTAKHLYSANELPDLSTKDNAIFERILLVEFPRTIPREERDPELPSTLLGEIDGVLRWAVNGLQTVLEQGGFTHDPEPHETRQRWDEHSGSVGQFRAAELEVTGDQEEDVIVKSDLYDEYKEFCESEEQRVVESRNQFTRSMTAYPGIGEAHRTPENYSMQKRCFTGVRRQEEE